MKVRRPLVWVLCVALGPTALADDPVSRLVDLVAQRLLLIDEVARYKWNARLPALDRARETALLQTSLVQAAELGRDPDFARAVLEAQLDASGRVQQAAFERWQRARQPPFANTRDLAHDLRRALDTLTRELLIAARDARAGLAACSARARLTDMPEGVANSAVWTIAVAPLSPKEPCSR